MNLQTKIKPRFKPIDIKEFMIKWNTMYPFDRWWRLKNNVPFGSKQHKEANFLDMLFELREDHYFAKFKKQAAEEVEFTEAEKLAFGFTQAEASKKEVKMNDAQIDKEFDGLDLTQFNEEKQEENG